MITITPRMICLLIITINILIIPYFLRKQSEGYEFFVTHSLCVVIGGLAYLWFMRNDE